MKKIRWIIIAFIFFSCSPSSEKKISLSGENILKSSIEYHDPNKNWSDAKIRLHIQEPRLNNPFRYSKIELSVLDGNFELIRNRENNISRHTIDQNGNSKVFFNNKEEIEKEFIEKYKLDPQKNFGYRNFYKMLLGLPMTLNETTIKNIGEVELEVYNNDECYKIPLELKKAMFSKYWSVFINKATFEFKGMEIVFPEDSTKGERLIFEGEIIIDEIKIPRIRHWYEYYDDSYSGSDIILKEIA